MNAGEAYSDFVGKIRDESYYRIKPVDETPHMLQEGEATEEQMLDVLQEVLGRPISSYKIFRAGWDYAQRELQRQQQDQT